MSSAATSFTRSTLRGVEGLVGGGVGTAAIVVCALVLINDLQIKDAVGHSNNHEVRHLRSGLN